VALMMIRQHGERAGLSDVTLLSLRHTFIANMLELGVSPVIISDLLGDRAMDPLRYYAPLVGEDLTVAVERMAAKLETRER
jgi:integrase